MNATLTNTRTATRSAALAACLTLLFAGATACGSDSKDSGRDGGAPAAQTETHPNALTSVDLIELAKSNQAPVLKVPVDWSPWPHEQGRHHISTRQHAPGYNKALLAER